MKLYFHPLSGHAHRAQLFASLIGVDIDLITVDLAAGAHKREEYLKLNPFGQVPVLVDGDTVVPDSNAIMVYLAKKLGRTDWLPENPEGAAQVQRWLAVASGPIAYGPAAARLVTVFGASFNVKEVIDRAHQILGQIDEALDGKEWITGGLQPTIADIALYSYIANAPEGNVDLSAYGNVRAWLARVEALKGFVPFTATAVGLAA